MNDDEYDWTKNLLTRNLLLNLLYEIAKNFFNFEFLSKYVSV